jgi:cell division protein FtsL
MENSYKRLLKQQIKELEIHIEQSTEKKEDLQRELNKLKIAEFEEDMREDSSQQLLKG